MPGRFVILHHLLGDCEHWDLMLERGNVLLTWQLPREPVSMSALPMPAKRIADHRKLYLDYEGPVSGDRGHVRRVDAGSVKFEKITESACGAILSGGRLGGRIRLLKDRGAWILDIGAP